MNSGTGFHESYGAEMSEHDGPDVRARLLAAAAACYAEHGVRGTTTREVARRAGASEVSIFRLFGSKHALLAEAKSVVASSLAPPHLPLRPGNPVSELTEWGRAVVLRLSVHRDVLRQDFAESGPGHHTNTVGTFLVGAGNEIARYLHALHGSEVSSARVDAAVAMFVAALATEAIVGAPVRGGDWLPPDLRVREYAAAALAAVGPRPPRPVS